MFICVLIFERGRIRTNDGLVRMMHLDENKKHVEPCLRILAKLEYRSILFQLTILEDRFDRNTQIKLRERQITLYVLSCT